MREVEEEEKRTGQSLETILIKKGLISEENLVSFLSGMLGIPKVDIDNYLIDESVLNLVPEEVARKYTLITIIKIGE